MDSFYVFRDDGRPTGPFTLAQLEAQRAADEIHPNDLVKMGSNGQWTPFKLVFDEEIVASPQYREWNLTAALTSQSAGSKAIGVLWCFLLGVGLLWMASRTSPEIWKNTGLYMLLIVALTLIGTLLKKVCSDDAWSLVKTVLVILMLLASYGCSQKKPERSIYPDDREPGPMGRLW